MAKISCVIHTHNSERYLAEVLSSVRWCDEIVIVDMESTDRTVPIAKKAGARIFRHKNIGLADPARAFGLSKCTHEWILAVDSDEIIPATLAARLCEAAEADEADVFWLCFRNFFFGRELKGSGWSYRDLYVPRFFRRGYLSYGAQVHNFIQISSNARVKKLISLEFGVIHFNYDSVSHFISKMNRYTDFESGKPVNDGNPFLLVCYHAIREIFGRFVIKRGYRDGWVGLYLSLMMALYRATSVAKRHLPDEQEAIALYRSTAAETDFLSPVASVERPRVKK